MTVEEAGLPRCCTVSLGSYFVFEDSKKYITFTFRDTSQSTGS
jgi:hypothetical protein